MKKKFNFSGVVRKDFYHDCDEPFYLIKTQDITESLKDFEGKDVDVKIEVKTKQTSKYKWVIYSKSKGGNGVCYTTNKIKDNVAIVFMDDDGDWGYDIPGYAEQCCISSKQEAKLIVQTIIAAKDKINA